MKCKKLISVITSFLMATTMLVTPVNAQATEISTEEIASNVTLSETTELAETEIETQQPTVPTEPQTQATLPIEKPTEKQTDVSTEKPTEKPTQAPTDISPVENFTYSNVTTNSITLNWTKNDDATGYVIYRMDNKTNSQYVKYAVIKNNATK